MESRAEQITMLRCGVQRISRCGNLCHQKGLQGEERKITLADALRVLGKDASENRFDFAENGYQSNNSKTQGKINTTGDNSLLVTTVWMQWMCRSSQGEDKKKSNVWYRTPILPMIFCQAQNKKGYDEIVQVMLSAIQGKVVDE